MADVLNINRERRALRVLERLDKRRLEGKFDFVVIVGSQKILAEQNILASASDYFVAMLSHDTKERQNGEVEMVDVDFESVRTCIDFIYGREVSVSIDKYQSLMFVARMMQLDEICDAIEERMVEQLTVKTFFTIHRLALSFGSPNLNIKCMRYAENYFSMIAKEAEFQTWDKSFIIELLQSRRTHTDEEKKLEIILELLKSNDDREKNVLELLKCLNFSEIPYDVGQRYIRDEPLIYESNECLRFFSLAFMDVASSSAKKTSSKIIVFQKKSPNLHLIDPKDDLVQDVCIVKPELPSCSVVNLDGDIYVLYKATVYRIRCFSLEASWEKMADMTEDHGIFPPTVVAEGLVYVIGGFQLSTDAVERYDPHNGRWQWLETKPKVSMGAAVLVSGGYIYRFGGSFGDDTTNIVERMDIGTLQWETISSMNEKKRFMSATEYKGMIYVAGGVTRVKDIVRCRTFESYDPSTNEWTVLPQMNITRSSFNLLTVNDQLYAVGGYASSPNSIEKYDFEKQEWKMLEIELENLEIMGSVLIKT